MSPTDVKPTEHEADPVAVRSAPPARVKDLEEAFQSNYPQVQYGLVEFISDHLADAGRQFGGDLQLPLILAIIGQTTIKAALRAQASGATLSSVPPRDRGLTSFRLADASGIPRETVRRKLHAMARRGWLERHGTVWVLALDGERGTLLQDLGGLDARGIARLARLYAMLTPFAAVTPPRPAGRPSRFPAPGCP